jgi:histidyl-tRNA synthetase
MRSAAPFEKPAPPAPRAARPVIFAAVFLLTMTPTSIPGTFDVLPDDQRSGIPGTAAWQWLEGVVRQTCARFGYDEIRTPILEPTELVARGVGAATDIVQKEMFAFEKGSTQYVLRPEVTAPVVRAYHEHHLAQKGGVQRLFYIGPCFRAERPQKGRYRQFHQFGVETIGSDSPAADAECLVLLLTLLEALGLRDLSVRLNSLGDPSDRSAFRSALVDYLTPHRDALSETSRARLASNPLRILDTKIEAERELLADAPSLSDFLSDDARDHHDQVRALLTAAGITWTDDSTLVRGLDYYGRTAFEIESPHVGAQSAVAGGGRYDGLSDTLGAPATPAVGFAAGIERVLLALGAQNAQLPQAPAPAVYALGLGERASRSVFALAGELRAAGVPTMLSLKGGSLKSQMKEAARREARFVVLLGDDELDQDVVALRDMGQSEQTTVPRADLIRHLTAALAR